MNPLPRWLPLLLASILTLAAAAPALGQDEGAPGADAAAASWSGEVEIGVDVFGFGGVARAGDFAGIRLALRDRGDRPRAVVVRLHLRDADGDTALYERPVTLNPGVAQGVWLYARLAYAMTAQSTLQVTVHELPDAGGADDDAVRAGRQIATGRISPQRALAAEDSIIGVVGRVRAGLDQYTAQAPGSELPPTGHEWIRIALLEPEAIANRMPDSWLGLAALEALVWTGGDPAALRLESAEALREWVAGGGHLVIVLPPVGEGWTNAASNPIYDLMPAVRITRREGVDMEPLRRLLTSNPQLPMPREGVVHSFTPADGAEAHEAMGVMADPDGRVVVVRRLFGVGAVTLVGIDLADRGLIGRLEAGRFWNRVLGKRQDVLSPVQMEELRLSTRGASFTLRDQRWIDTDYARHIDKTGRAGVGVLLGLIVFGLYLVVAGPGGFAVLRRRGLARHSWSAFVGAVAVFTLAAWIGASAIRPSQVEVTHLTVLDHVYGQPVQRGRVWFSVLLPTYGEQTVSIGDEDMATVWGAAMSPWESPDRTSSASFPDSRRYSVDAREPESIRVPTRSTVKEFMAEWKGPPRWGMPLPIGDALGVDGEGLLRGVVRHDLPAALEDVTIIHVERPAPLLDSDEGAPLPSFVRAWKLPQAWGAGEDLDLSTLGRFDPGNAYLDAFTQRAQALPLGGEQIDPRFLPVRMEMMSLFSMLRPPQYIGVRPDNRTMVRRRATHGLDLSRWFTQPSLIIIGQVADAPGPIPIRVDGEGGADRGRTLVRWVYPLPSDPVRPGQPDARGTR